MRFRRLGAFAVGAVALSAVLGACAEETTPSAELEQRVLEALADRFEDPDDVEVICPDDLVIEAGSTLACDLAVGDAAPQTATFDVNEDKVVMPASAVIPTADAEDFLVEQIRPSAEVAVDCGETPLIVGDVGDTFTCTATRLEDGAIFDVDVDIAALDGSVHRVQFLVPPTTTTLPTAAVPPG